MKTITVANSKGGVGKSVIADQIAFWLEAHGHVVSFVVRDLQGGVTHVTVEKPNAEYTVVDTPSGIHAQLNGIFECTDVFVIPTRPSMHGLSAIERAVRIARKQDAECLIVVNEYDNSRALDRDYIAWLDYAGFTETTILVPTSELIIRANLDGASVAETAAGFDVGRAFEKLGKAVE